MIGVWIIFLIVLSGEEYWCLERYSKKQGIIVTFVTALLYGIIINTSATFLVKIVFAVIISLIVTGICDYVYDKYSDFLYFMVNSVILEICVTFGVILALTLYTMLKFGGIGAIIKYFGMILLFFIAINAIGYKLLELDYSKYIILLVDTIIYIFAINFAINKMGLSNGNLMLKIIFLSLICGFITYKVDSNSYNEVEKFSSYLVVTVLKTYCYEATIMYLYLEYKLYQAFGSLRELYD